MLKSYIHTVIKYKYLFRFSNNIINNAIFFLSRLELDDPLDAVAVHGGGGKFNSNE